MEGSGLEWEHLALRHSFSRLTVLDLDVGPSTSKFYKESHGWLLPDVASLLRLEHLSLKQLAFWPMSLSVLSTLTSLRLLHVLSSVQSAQDFSCLPQITSLQFCQASHKLVTITMPQGGLVALKVLNLHSCCRVMGLDAAIQLTAVKLSEFEYQHGLCSGLPAYHIFRKILCLGFFLMANAMHCLSNGSITLASIPSAYHWLSHQICQSSFQFCKSLMT